MAKIIVPDENQRFETFGEVRDYLKERGIVHDQWSVIPSTTDAADQQTILDAYADVLEPFMAAGGYATADVISVGPATDGLAGLRAKFLAEHTHAEDEVRFFVDGRGLFWFNPGNENPVFALLCQAGDLISVPAGTRHWFDLGEDPSVKAIRIFTDSAGWVAQYTGSGVEQRYNTLPGLWQ